MLSIAATNILVHACAVLDGAACYTPLTRTASAGGKLSATPPFAALAKSRFNIESTSPWVMRRDALHTRPHFFGFDHLFTTHYKGDAKGVRAAANSLKRKVMGNAASAAAVGARA